MSCNCYSPLLTDRFSPYSCQSSYLSTDATIYCLRLEHSRYFLYALLHNQEPSSNYLYTQLSSYILPIIRQQDISNLETHLHHALRLLDLHITEKYNQTYSGTCLLVIIDTLTSIAYCLNAGGGTLHHLSADSVIHTNTGDYNLMHSSITLMNLQEGDHLCLHTNSLHLPAGATAQLLQEYSPEATVAALIAKNTEATAILIIAYTSGPKLNL
jgi:hypothetical protein